MKMSVVGVEVAERAARVSSGKSRMVSIPEVKSERGVFARKKKWFVEKPYSCADARLRDALSL